MTVAPAVDLLPPARQVIRIFAQGDFVHHGEHVRQYSFGRPYDWHFHFADGFQNAGWVDVDVNELRTGHQLIRVVGNAVIKERRPQISRPRCAWPCWLRKNRACPAYR